MKAAFLALCLALPASAEDRRSSYEDMSADLRALQDDPFANPGLLAALEGEALWSEPAGADGRACADCHGAVETSMDGVAARYPAWDEAAERPVDLAGRINLCRTRHQGAEPLARESAPLLALEMLVTLQSKGRAITPDPDPRLDPWRARGEALFRAEIGQLDLSCADCHQDNAGQSLAASTIPQGHPTGYPQYRLEWESVGSLSRRFDGCFTGVRAEPYAHGSDAYLALELFLKARAAGLPVEAPAVRP